MPRFVQVNEPVASRRRVFLQIVLADGITPALGEAGGQPDISTDGSAWTPVGIGVLVAIGDGRYYADLTQSAVSTPQSWIETRYMGTLTAECPGDSVQVGYQPVPSGGGGSGGTSRFPSLSLSIGEDKTFSLSMNPKTTVTGWMVQWQAQSNHVSFTFPPLTVPIQDPLFPYMQPLGQPLVVPGVQPALPTTGSTQKLTKDNALAGGLTITDATNGVFQIALASADTVNLSPDLYQWRLMRVDAGFRQVLMSGPMILMPIY